MAEIRSSADIAQKWGRVTPLRTDDYQRGVQSPRKNWEQNTVAAETNYEQGIQAAIGRKAFGKGARAAGQAKWQTKAVAKGVPRWGPGVQVSVPDYQAGFEPFRATIEATALPPRKPAGDPSNIDRVTRIAQALRAKKVGGTPTGR